MGIYFYWHWKEGRQKHILADELEESSLGRFIMLSYFFPLYFPLLIVVELFSVKYGVYDDKTYFLQRYYRMLNIADPFNEISEKEKKENEENFKPDTDLKELLDSGRKELGGRKRLEHGIE